MSIKRNTQKKSISGLKSSKRTFVFSSEDPQMEQINGHWVGLSHGIAQGIVHGLISYHQSCEMISHFGYRDVKRQKVVPPLHRESPKLETRNAKSVQDPFQHFGYRDLKEQRSSSSTASGIVETRNAKCESCPGAISAFRLPGCQVTKGRSSTASGIPETQNTK
jgi:hypothetical protein